MIRPLDRSAIPAQVLTPVRGEALVLYFWRGLDDHHVEGRVERNSGLILVEDRPVADKGAYSDEKDADWMGVINAAHPSGVPVWGDEKHRVRIAIAQRIGDDGKITSAIGRRGPVDENGLVCADAGARNADLTFQDQTPVNVGVACEERIRMRQGRADADDSGFSRDSAVPDVDVIVPGGEVDTGADTKGGVSAASAV